MQLMPSTRYPHLPRVLVHAEVLYPRLEAALHWAFTSVLGLGWQWEGDAADFATSDATWKLQYGGSPICGHWIRPSGLLAGRERTEFPPETEGTSSGDILALIFWMASRMEEHTGRERRDGHGRFDPEGSHPLSKGWLERPICEVWAFSLGTHVLGEDWAAHEERLLAEYRVCPTLDVDSAFAYRGKGVIRTTAAWARDVLTGNWSQSVRRIRTSVGRTNDPYDTYSRAAEWHEELGLSARWFFLLAQFGAHDKGLPSSSAALRNLMRSLEQAHAGSVQWHPGYAAASDATRLAKEYQTFREIMGHNAVASRQHYLKMVPNTTRRALLDLGIQEDHTEGHAVTTGFRGGFSRPRPWYDLDKEALTPLMIHPFAAMDATLCRYMGLVPAEVPHQVKQLAVHVKEVGGTLSLLWHNESLSSMNEWSGWDDVYPNVLKAVL